MIMEMISIIGSKPVLIGLHLGFAVIGIDAFLWYTAEVRKGNNRKLGVLITGIASFVLSWIIGGFYYVKYYGDLVKPVIKEGLAPWAHTIAMETKEHIFLFIIPIAITVFMIALLPKDRFESLGLRRITTILSVFVAGIGLVIGILGFMVSAAARWGVPAV